MAQYAISPREAGKIMSTVSNQKKTIERLRKGKEVEKVVQVAETLGAAGAIGWLRGKMQQPDGSWNIPGTTIDIELVAGVGLLGMSYAKMLGKYDDDANAMALGVLSHYMGQVGRKFGATGQFSLVAGTEEIVGVGSLQQALNNSGV